MSSEADLREDMCQIAQSLFERGITHDSTGNISALGGWWLADDPNRFIAWSAGPGAHIPT